MGVGLQGSRPHKVSPAAAALPLTPTPPPMSQSAVHCIPVVRFGFLTQVHVFSFFFFFCHVSYKCTSHLRVRVGAFRNAHCSYATDGEKPERRQSVWEIHPGVRCEQADSVKLL